MKIKEFKDTQLILSRVDDENFLFYSVYYAIYYIRMKKSEKYDDDEFKSDLPEKVFLKLGVLKEKLVLNIELLFVK